jgi:hypothetical protein
MELKSVTMPVPILIEHSDGLSIRFADVSKNIVYGVDKEGNLVPESQELSTRAISMLIGGFVRQRVEIPEPPAINIKDLERDNDASFKNGPRNSSASEQAGS